MNSLKNIFFSEPYSTKVVVGSEIRAESHQLSSDPPSTALLGLFEGLQILHALGVVGEASHGFHDLVFAFHDLCLHEREQKAGAASWGRGSSVLGTPHGGVPKANQRKTLTPSCSMMAWSHMIFYQTKTPKKHPKKDVAWCSRMTPTSTLYTLVTPRPLMPRLLRGLLRRHVLVPAGGLGDEAVEDVPHGPAPPRHMRRRTFFLSRTSAARCPERWDRVKTVKECEKRWTASNTISTGNKHEWEACYSRF